METHQRLEILPQPDNFTCGPTCLQALYRYFGDDVPLDQVIAEVPMLAGGGTLDVLLANHALARGYSAAIYTYNLHLFDPTWFGPAVVDVAERLRMQAAYNDEARFQIATDAYLRFLEAGGELRYEELTTTLLRKYLSRQVPVLTGLSATYLYGTSREYGPEGIPDDVRGQPQGHFVLLCGYDKETREVLIADPLQTNPLFGTNKYVIGIDRVVCAILLGIVTYDSNLLVIEPKPKPQPRRKRKLPRRADPHRRQ